MARTLKIKNQTFEYYFQNINLSEKITKPLKENLRKRARTLEIKIQTFEKILIYLKKITKPRKNNKTSDKKAKTLETKNQTFEKN